MENAKSVNSASVSNNPPYHIQTSPGKNSETTNVLSFDNKQSFDIKDVSNSTNASSEEKESDTGSILSLVNQLSFNIDEKDKEQFFTELENTLAQQSESEDIPNYRELITFFIKHTKPNGQISA